MIITQAHVIFPGDDVKALIENGMEFLDKAIGEFEAKAYKHSVVSFWTAVEILLKVPLANEHWTLVCTGKNISRKNYLAGNFQSVNYVETCSRLKDVLEKPLPAETENLFKTIQSHRNRVVHFYHNAFTEADVIAIVGEQASAWFALNRYLREDWKSVFDVAHSWKLAFSETRLIRGNEFYAAARLKHIQPKLTALMDAGSRLDTCPECRQQAVVETTIAEGEDECTLQSKRCEVCSSTSRSVHFLCPECSEPQMLEEGETDFTCSDCRTEIERYELLDGETFRSIDEQMDSVFPAGCTSCMSPNSVCPFGEGFICTQCLSYHDEIECCECCGHASDNVGEFSRFKGCEFCDGDPRLHGD